jgi:hypothetical protein
MFKIITMLTMFLLGLLAQGSGTGIITPFSKSEITAARVSNEPEIIALPSGQFIKK